MTMSFRIILNSVQFIMSKVDQIFGKLNLDHGYIHLLKS
jgi:hypothetical protein